jgi:predicted HicB family RNase H-like nuclease
MNQPQEGEPPWWQAKTSSTPAKQAPSSYPTMPPKPRRITVTIPSKLHHALVDRSDREGRSLSNLVAFLLETALSKSGSPPL